MPVVCICHSMSRFQSVRISGGMGSISTNDGGTGTPAFISVGSVVCRMLSVAIRSFTVSFVSSTVRS